MSRTEKMWPISMFLKKAIVNTLDACSFTSWVYPLENRLVHWSYELDEKWGTGLWEQKSDMDDKEIQEKNRAWSIIDLKEAENIIWEIEQRVPFSFLQEEREMKVIHALASAQAEIRKAWEIAENV